MTCTICGTNLVDDKCPDCGWKRPPPRAAAGVVTPEMRAASAEHVAAKAHALTLQQAARAVAAPLPGVTAAEPTPAAPKSTSEEITKPTTVTRRKKS